MVRYDYVLLDADNTLFDFDGAERDALDLTLRHHGYPLSEESYTAYHMCNAALWKAFERGEIRQEEILSRRFQELIDRLGGGHAAESINCFYMDRLAEQGRLFPGAHDFCMALAPHCTIAIVTNGVASVQRGRLQASPIRPLFPKVYISTEIGVQKPSAAFFEIVCQDLPIPDKSRAVIMGDSLTSDILGGLNAGIDTIWYHPGNTGPGEVQPTFTVRNYAEAARIILNGHVGQ